MFTIKHTGICAAALLVLQTLCTTQALSASAAGPAMSDEMSKQDGIYKSRGVYTPGGYTVDRSLSDYADALSPGFDRTLANLGPTDRWLDIGAGRGRAIMDYYSPEYDQAHQEGRERRGRKAQTVALSIEDRRTPLWRHKAATLEANQMQYLFNKRLREYSAKELGRFQMITDVVGGFSYTENLSKFMETVLGILEVNGSFYTLLQDVQSEGGSNRPYYDGAPYLTEIDTASGSKLRICSWLKAITCAEVSCLLRTDYKPPIEAFHVRKFCKDTVVPVLLPVHYQAGTPPERRFKLEN